MASLADKIEVTDVRAVVDGAPWTEHWQFTSACVDQMVILPRPRPAGAFQWSVNAIRQPPQVDVQRLVWRSRASGDSYLRHQQPCSSPADGSGLLRGGALKALGVSTRWWRKRSLFRIATHLTERYGGRNNKARMDAVLIAGNHHPRRSGSEDCFSPITLALGW